MKTHNERTTINRSIGPALIIATLLFLVTPAFAQNLTFMDFDKNGDEQIDQKEFEKLFADSFWDDWIYEPSSESGLNEQAFYRSAFNQVDIDDDDLVSKQEWKHGYGHYYGGEIADDFDAYDLNNDQYISYSEYSKAMTDKRYFSTWDTNYDAYADAVEVATAIFNQWDQNSNGSWDAEEFKEFDTFYGDI